jgi:hypothetical protein
MAELLAVLSTHQVQGLLAASTGEQWLRILSAVRDNEVDGESLSHHMQSPATLALFFRDQLDCAMTPFAASQLHKKLLVGAGGSQAAIGHPPSVRGGGATIPRPAIPVAMVQLRVIFSQAGGGAASANGSSSKKITVEVPVGATPAVVKRCIMDELALPLSATLVLSHAGRSLQEEEEDNKEAHHHPRADTTASAIRWEDFSVVHAVQLTDSTPLTLANAATHAAVAAHVMLDSKKNGSGGAIGGNGGGAGNAVSAAWRLVVHDTGLPLGSGANGAVYPGLASFASTGSSGRRETLVAVKKFFMLESPGMYGLITPAAVAGVVERELLPEVNTLLGLAHPNVVRLRCVGVGDVCGAAVPAYVAMDFCGEGTLALWIQQQRLTDVRLVAFLGDLVDAMVYVSLCFRVLRVRVVNA